MADDHVQMRLIQPHGNHSELKCIPYQPVSFHHRCLRSGHLLWEGWGHLQLLTEFVAILCCGGDPFAVHLDMLATGPAVELVLPDLPPAQLVCHGALVPHVLVKIRRRLILPLCLQREK